MSFDCRLYEFELLLNDKPGSLESILSIFRESGANVVEVHHHRFASHAAIGQIAVSITVETRDKAHIARLKGVIQDRGYPARLREPS